MYMSTSKTQGGPGTWDELWEMACSRHIGFHSMPIVCVNVDGYYDNFKDMLSRAHDDELLYKHPDEILHFEETADAAVKWIETYHAKAESTKEQKKVIRKRTSMLKRMQSNLSGSSLSPWRRMTSFFGEDIFGGDDDDEVSADGRKYGQSTAVLIFAAGVTVGMLTAFRVGVRTR